MIFLFQNAYYAKSFKVKGSIPVKYVPARGFLEDRISYERRLKSKHNPDPDSDSDTEAPDSSLVFQFTFRKHPPFPLKIHCTFDTHKAFKITHSVV